MKNKYIFLIVSFLCLQFSALAQSFKLPKYEKFTLKNGLTVYLMEQKEVPLIYVSMVFDGGGVKDGQNYGLASATANSLLFGTKKFTKAQIEEATDFIGAGLSNNSGKETAFISASFAKKDQEQMFGILQEIVMNPTFDQAEFDKYKERQINNLAQAKESPNRVIGEYFNGFLYGSHPYANPSATPSSMKNITLEQVKNFYASYYVPSTSAIAIVGDFSTAEMKSKITALLSSWTGKKQSIQKLNTPELNFNKRRVLLVNKDDARETTFWIGGKGVSQDNPDYVAIQVVNTILGGRFTSWLNDALRVNSGLTYGARSSFSMLKSAGTFYISTFTKTSTTVEAIDMALQVLDSLHTKGISNEVLISAKNYVKGNFPPRYETSGSLANLLTDMFVYGYNESFINDFQKNVESLTTEKANEIVKKYFPKNNLQFVLVGKSSEIKEKVKKYGEITEKQIKADGF